MEIFHISAECYPMAKVGGLADVVGALPKYQTKAGHDVRVVVPCYDTKFRKENDFECVHWGNVKLGNFNFPFSVLLFISSSNSELKYFVKFSFCILSFLKSATKKLYK